MTTNNGFRFIWSRDEGELFQLQVALGLTGLALMTKAVYRTSASPESHPSTDAGVGVPGGLAMTGWARFVAYLSATVALVFVAFFMGVAHFEYTECRGPGDGECDLAALGGFVWSAGALLLAVVTITVAEVALHSERRHHG